VFVGQRSGTGTSTGANNVAVGSNTLRGNNAGSNNAVLGHQALIYTTGGNNTAVGYQAGDSITTGTNNIVIGYDADASSATVSNEITLGNANVTALRIPGLQSGASDGDVLTFASGTGLITLQAAGGGGGGLTPYSIPSGKNAIYAGFVPTSVTGAQNVVLSGGDTGTNLTSGQDNILIGYRAGVAITTSNSNVCIGSRAGQGLTTNTGFANTIVGTEAGGNTSSGATAIGWLAGNRSNTVSIGDQAGRSASGSANLSVHIGSNAGYSNSGSTSIMIGGSAARNNSSDGHTSIGYNAGYSQTSGVTNTYIGYQSGYNTTTGGDNTYVGYQTGYSASGSHNTAVGDGSFGGGFGHTGSDNASFGYLALQAPTGASNYNVAMGAEALRASGTKSNNVGIGYKAGTALATGEGNTFVGYQAGLTANPSGGSTGQNTCIGNTSGGAITTGIYNTFLGSLSGNGGGGTSAKVTTGNFNTMLGYGAKGNSSAIANATSLGYQAQSTGSNQVTLGDSSIGTLRCQATSITSVSDERDKTEIEDLGYGLAFIDALQPRQFVWDNRAEIDGDGNEYFSANKGKKDFGFVAQEVKELDNDTLRLVYDEDPNRLELSYGKLVPILVKAIQELKEEVEILKSQNK